MPLTDENRGTNADGSNSEDYCVYCYKKGEFTQDFTMSQMIEFCLQFLDEWNVQTECKLSPVQAKEQMPMGAIVRIIACIVTKKVSLPKILQ